MKYKMAMLTIKGSAQCCFLNFIFVSLYLTTIYKGPPNTWELDNLSLYQKPVISSWTTY